MIQDEWKSIAARIEGIRQANEVLAVALSKVNADPGTSWMLDEQAKAVTASLEAFQAKHAAVLPTQAISAIKRYIAGGREIPSSYTVLHKNAHEIVRLLTLKSEIEYLLSGNERRLRNLSVRGFEHLQRLIAVNKEVRENWKQAFEAGEEACERLGAIHLLLHGIYAFKAYGENGRTDLVYGDPITNYEGLVSASEGLVLTEWKLVKSPTDRDTQAQTAREQAKLYAAGTLAGVELSTTRFAVLVSAKELQPLAPIQEGDVTWVHINIAVEPSTPSKVAKTLAGTKPS